MKINFKDPTFTHDWTEKLNGRWTPSLLLLLSVVAFYVQCLYSPIQCSAPAHFTSSLVSYAHQSCWQANRINFTKVNKSYENWESALPVVSKHGVSPSDSRTLYQYVPVCLILQAVVFKLLYILMHSGKSALATYIKVEDNNFGNEMTSSFKGSVARKLALHLDKVIRQRSINVLSLGSMTLFVLFSRLIFIINLATQFGILDVFLKAEKETSYGAQFLNNIQTVNGSYWKDSPAFPRHVFCDYEIFHLQNTQRYRIQCFLTANGYHEQILAILWVWFCLSLSITLTYGLFHGITVVIPFCRERFVKNHLLLSDLKHPVTDVQIRRFADSYLGQDLITVLENLSQTSDTVLVMDIVTELWKIHFNMEEPLPRKQNVQQPIFPSDHPHLGPQPLSSTPNQNPQIHYGATTVYPTVTLGPDTSKENIPLVESTSSSLYPNA